MGHQALTLEVTGEGVRALEAERGGHRVQRVPRTERNGRVHSSTVTVAVMRGSGVPVVESPWQRRSAADFEVGYFSGTGPGGQNRNKVQACCRIRHLPTGTVRTAQTRSRENSRQLAMQAMEKELDRLVAEASGAAENAVRRDQVGSGDRSDRRRVWAFRRDAVDDLVTGKSVRCTEALRGKLEGLW